MTSPDPADREHDTTVPAGAGRRTLRAVVRLTRAVGVLAIASAIVLPNLPGAWVGEWVGAQVSTTAGWLRQVSFVQSWRMYAPNPQRAQTYMNLTAQYDDGSSAHLEETRQERHGWGRHFAWDKSRVDIWRHYANFHPKNANDHRKWYLRGVCVREARRGHMPQKVVMEHVTRRFTNPAKVAKGAPALGRPRKSLVTVGYCRTQRVRQMMDADPLLSAG
ncbi:MAG: hypothetical protein K0V04_11130 [Deltaproteobacteria bacterium]|nr:hypothetical protein [Deltaproteobacteria bacterium]